MPGEMPETGIADLPAVLGICLEGRELSVGQALAAQGHHPKKNSKEVGEAEMHPRIRVDQQAGNTQQGQQQRLRLKEPEERHTLATRDRTAHLRIASILDGVMTHHPFPKVKAQAHAPNDHHQRHEVLACRFPVGENPVEQGKRCKAEGPGDVHDPGVADPHRHDPDPEHQQTRNPEGDGQKEERAHAGRDEGTTGLSR